MSTFFKRLLQVIDYQGFKNINDFALNGLKYDSSSKLNRLKDENKKPSVEILEDISNKFQNIDIHWLVTNKGEMLRNSGEKEVVQSDSSDKTDIIAYQKEIIATLREKLDNCENEKKRTNTIS